MDLLLRNASLEPATFDAEAGTVTAVFSTGAEVRRRDLQGEFLERLSLEPGSVNLEPLIGAPVLNAHRRDGVENVLGVVEGAWLEEGRALARLRFSRRSDVQGIAEDVRAGVIRNVSVGYEVNEWREERRDGQRIKTAVRWTPREVSLVPLGADSAARVRAKGGGDMEQTNELQVQARSIAAALALPEAAADEAVRQHQNLAAVRAALIAEAAKAIPLIDNRQPAVVVRDSRDGLIERMADGLYSRIDARHEPKEGREFAYARFTDLARRLLAERGLSTLGSPVELLQRAHTTSDFAVLLAEVFNKSLFELRRSPSPITQVFRRTTMADFRARHILEMSDGPALEQVNENGEITFGTIALRALAGYKLASYARGFSVSFQTLVNDDVGALADLSAKMSRGARAWFESFLVDTVIANPKLADGKAVFHADHGNLAATGTQPIDSEIAAARLAIRKQVDASGNPIGVAPRYILAPAKYETTIDKLLAQLYPSSSADAEVAARGLVPVIEPRFDLRNQIAWYLFADPSEAPVFEYAELSGYEGPRAESRPGWNTLGTEFRVVWHLGAGAIDHRGAFKNPGSAS